MKKMLSTTMLVTSLLLISQVQAMVPAEHNEEAARMVAAAQSYKDFFTPIPLELRRCFKGDAGEYNEDLGVSVVRVFETTDVPGPWLMLGDRFGKGVLKTGVGGQVKPTQRTLAEAYKDELREEWFEELPVKDFHFVGAPDQETVVVGGIHQVDGGFKPDNWGPNIGRVGIEKGYSFAQLQESQRKMNVNATLHVPVANFFFAFGQLDDETVDQVHGRRQTKAREILETFDMAREWFITPLHHNVRSYLEALSASGDAPLPEGYDATTFAKEFVHDYTEFETFYLVPLHKYMEMIDVNARNMAAEQERLVAELGSSPEAAAVANARKSARWTHRVTEGEYGVNKPWQLFGAEGQMHSFMQKLFAESVESAETQP